MIRLDVTLRKPEEFDAYEQEIERLNGVILAKEREIKRMNEFAALYLQTFDQLKMAKERMEAAGLDTAWIKLR